MKLSTEDKKTIEKAAIILYRESILHRLNEHSNVPISTSNAPYLKVIETINNMEVSE